LIAVTQEVAATRIPGRLDESRTLEQSVNSERPDNSANAPT